MLYAGLLMIVALSHYHKPDYALIQEVSIALMRMLLKKKKTNKGNSICVCDALCVLELAIAPPYWTRKEKMKATAKCWYVELLEAGALSISKTPVEPRQRHPFLQKFLPFIFF